MLDVDKSEHGSRDLLCTSVDEDSEHGVGLLTGKQRLFLRPGSNLRGYLVYATIAVLWILSLFSIAKLSSRGCSKDGFAAGFDTDLGEPQRPSFNVSGQCISSDLERQSRCVRCWKSSKSSSRGALSTTRTELFIEHSSLARPSTSGNPILRSMLPGRLLLKVRNIPRSE